MSTNYIEKLHLRNFRQFKKLDVEFNNKFNFIAGPNGCGKTSILTGISHCFHYGNLAYSRFYEASEFWTDITVSTVKKRIGFGANSVISNSYRDQTIKAWHVPPTEAGRETISLQNIRAQLPNFCPLFIGAERSIKYKQIGGMTREQPLDKQLEQYTHKGTQALYGDSRPNIKQWFINRYFIIEKEWAAIESENWAHMLYFLPSIAPFNSNFSYVRTERDLEPIFSIYGQECYMEELSAGFQAVLSIIANIIEWIENTNSDAARLVRVASGTVLIDELDVHLHPEWQFSLREGLSNIFPNLQFIVTTHSPHLLSSAQENEIIIMDRNYDQSEFTLKPIDKKFSGWNTDQILSEIMGVMSLANKEYEKIILQAFTKYESGSADELKEAISRLSMIAHPSDPILAVLNTKYASLVALSND